jgi:hypothetical protein
MISVQVKVAEQISQLGPSVEDQVVRALADREKNRRADALVKALDDLARFEQDFKKLKPDQVAFDDKGEKVSETFSKIRIDERDKLTKKIEKYTKAINKALENKDFGDVYNLSNNNDN